ncbi:MAG: transcription elongation factor GreA [Lachnospiraceae bacterium]|nr:transcription elongation factor GreA [Lachnospiraceae bacterium]
MKDRLTRSDIKKMQAEIDDRIVNVRPAILERVKEARAQGDLSENFEYHAAKRERSINESRIRYLENMIKTAVIIDDSSAEDEVGINNTVTVFFEEDNEEEKYKIVTTVRTDSINGLISIDSPLGKAVMGRKKGDRVLVKVNEDISYSVVIKDIDKSTTDEEDKINRY